MKDFRMAAVQCCPSVDGDLQENLALIDTSLQQARAKGAAFAAFPETTLTGYLLDSAAIRERALHIDDPIVQKAVALSADHDIFFAFGLFERSGSDFFNTYVLAGEGKRIGIQRKVHVPARETGLFRTGHDFKVFDLPFAEVGLSICYDNEFPESHSCLAVQGAEVIVMPAAWAEHWEREDYIERSGTDEEVVEERCRWMHMMFGARCRDTGTYSVLVNHSGMEAGGPWRFVGKSMVFAPTGRVVAEAGAWADEILYADLDARLLESYREMDSYALKNRQPKAYTPLVEQEGRA